MKEILNSISKFTGADTDDFQLWQQKVLMYLSTKDLEVFVDQDPAEDAGNDTLRHDKKAKSIICCCLHDGIVSSIMKERTAHQAWKLLERLYQKKSRSTRTRLIAEFWSCTKGDSSVATFVAAIQAMQAKLRAIGKELTDEDMTDRLLSGLPSSFDAFTVTLDSQTEVKFAPTASSLINFEAQIEHRAREAATVFATTTKRPPRCSYHNTNAHDNSQCWHQHPELRTINKRIDE